MKNDLRGLLADVCRGEKNAFELLVERYRVLTEGMVRRFSPSFGISGDGSGDGAFDIDDLRQCAAMALYRAAETYRPDDEGKNVSFGLYAKICINNAMISELRKYRRSKERATELSKVENKRESGRVTETDILYRIASDEGAKEVLKSFRAVLSPYEKEIFEHYIVGKSVTEIAERLGRNEKSVSNALYRMKVKIRGLLKK